MSTATIESQESRRSRQHPHQRLAATAVLRSLTEYCARLQPGDVVPTHTELMRQLNASERSVRGALDELRRDGVIVRRNGYGTFISDASHRAATQADKERKSLLEKNTVVAITKPDRAVFDSAMNLLCEQVENEGLELSCQFIQNATPSLSAKGEKPLGYILFRRGFFEFGRALQEAGHRVVVVGAPDRNETVGVPNVYGDHETGGALVMEHLLELGHERIVLFGNDSIMSSLRHKGHKRAIHQVHKRDANKANAHQGGKQVSVQLLTFAEVANWKNRPDLVRAYFHGPDAPTAVLAWNDHEAVALLGHLGRAGLRVPEDVSLVGYDNLREGQLIHPALTTVETAINQQLRAALDILTRETPVSPHHCVIVLPSLIRRDSSATLIR